MQTFSHISLPAQRILSWKFSALSFFMVLGLLKLTNLNYYLSKLLGFETEINNTGGNAFNFTNYIAFGALLFLLIAKISKEKYHWRSAWPLYILIGIYLINGYLAPYTNYLWVLYQCIFLLVALVLHFLSFKSAMELTLRLKYGIRWLYWMCIGLVIVMTIIVMSQVSLSQYFEEFTQSFVQSLDDYGIMKQFYGYLLGFLASYTLFIMQRSWLQLGILGLLLFAGIGIRSMLIGLVGAGFLFTVRKPNWFVFYILAAVGSYWVVLHQFFELLIYDTRYYAYLNAWDISQRFPYGLGLGGYPVYTEIFSRQLFGSFYNVESILDYVPVAPESDLVHLFGSLGLVLGGLHILIIGRILWLTVKFQNSMNSGHKCILFYFGFMTFFGISEDSMFSINYWIFFGIASGLVAYLCSKHKEERLIHSKIQSS